jgi:hypothetical protein
MKNMYWSHVAMNHLKLNGSLLKFYFILGYSQKNENLENLEYELHKLLTPSIPYSIKLKQDF